MARTTHSTGLQTTTGPVPTAVLPTDPVPLSQAGNAVDIIWSAHSGLLPQVTVSRQVHWKWTCELFELGLASEPKRVPFQMRLKEVGWYPNDRNVTLNVYRSDQVVATIGRNAHAYLNLLFNADQKAYFGTSSFIRLATGWTLAARWDIVARPTITPTVPDVLPVTALTAGRGPTAGLQSTVLNPENQDVPEIVARPKRGFAERIKRLFR